MKKLYSCVFVLVMILLFPTGAFAQDHGEQSIALYYSIPFLLMLGSIAVIPLKWEHWWENNNNKLMVALVLGIPVGLFFFFLTSINYSILSKNMSRLSYMSDLCSSYPEESYSAAR